MGKRVHMAHKVTASGHVSALCFRVPKCISYTQGWTNRPEAVTCPKCLDELSFAPASPPPSAGEGSGR